MYVCKTAGFMGKEGVSLPYLADAVIVVIFLLFIILGVKRGFVRSVLDLVGTLAAMLVSMWFSGIAAQWVFSTFLQESLTRQIAEALQAAPAADAADAVLSVVPEILRGGLEAFGITSDAINQAVAGTSGQAAAAVVAVLSPMVVSVLRGLFALVLFVFLLVIFRILSGVVCRIFRLPVLRQLDKGLGILLGITQAVLITVLLCFCAQALISVSSPWLVETIQASQVYQFYLSLGA